MTIGVGDFGISEIELLNVSISPNPFSESLNIINDENAELNFQIFNLHGQQVYSSVLLKGRNHFETGELAKGIYWIYLLKDGKSQG